MHRRETVAAALAMAGGGQNATDIGRQLGISRSTVRDWLAGAVPTRRRPLGDCPVCNADHAFDQLDSRYVHLLGLYLGDGYLVAHRRGVFKLRITLDVRYPRIIDEARRSTEAVIGFAAVYPRADRCVEIVAYSRQWACLIPQHGPGKKHDRVIALSDWQRRLVEEWPEQLLRGLIESDGCRFQNTGRGGWSHARYAFSNRSADIHEIFRGACDVLAVHWTASGPFTTYVSRVADVDRFDGFIGPKR